MLSHYEKHTIDRLKECSNDYAANHLSSNDWNGAGRPLNVESRGLGFQSNYFYIYEFIGETQDTAAAREEGGKTACGREPLLDWMSWSWSRGSPPLAWRSNGAE